MNGENSIEAEPCSSKKPDNIESLKELASKMIRHPILTEKGKDFKDQIIRRDEKAFYQNYDQWKKDARYSRCRLKELCTEEKLNELLMAIKVSSEKVTQNYDSLLRNSAVNQPIVQKKDTCDTITADIISLIDGRLRSVEQYKSHVEKERVRGILNKQEYSSVFGDSITESNVSLTQRPQIKSHSSSCNSDDSGQRDVEAVLASKRIEVEASKELHIQQQHLDQIYFEMRQNELLMQKKLEDEKRKLEKMSLETDLKIAEAKAKVYNEDNVSVQHRQIINATSFEPIKESSICKNDSGIVKNEDYFTKQTYELLQNNISMSRLPAPEPSVFNGNPIEYINWKISFKTLFNKRGLNPAEKMYYLKRYLRGPALKAIEGFFLSDSEEAYQSAWKLLEERYGHPFYIQEAYRNKLDAWQKIRPKDGAALREYADFLQACRSATTEVPGLTVLNDCKENQKMCTKLPEWLQMRWNREVSQCLEKEFRFPPFSSFVDFIDREARIVNNPITSFNSLKFNDNKESTKQNFSDKSRSTTLVTSSKQPSSSEKPSKSCHFCHQSDHFIMQCTEFEKISMSGKRAFIKENKLCFGCLRKGHLSRDCKKRHSCQICKSRHPTLLHEDRNVQQPVMTITESSATSCRISQNDENSTSLIVPVWVSSANNPGNEILTYAILDNQSDSTFVLDDLAKELTNDYTPVRLKLSTMISESSLVATNVVRDLIVRGMNQNISIPISSSYTSEFIPGEKSQIPTNETAINWPHLNQISNEIPAMQKCEIGILIGYNCSQALIPREAITGQDGDPYAIKTDLGWGIIGGSTSNRSCDRICNRIKVKQLPEVNPHDVLAALQADFKDTNCSDKTVSQDDIRFLEILEENIVKGDEDKYIMPLPFKTTTMPTMPNNKKAALFRLESLKRKLQTNSSYKKDYIMFMKDIMERGDVEEANNDPREGEVWYLPHHGVYHPRKKDKIRVVFDCSATYKSQSLNSKLLTGPDLINSLTGVMCRFREHPVAFVCDIKKMFHQFLVRKDHRDYLRFLWWEEGDINKPIKEYRMKVHLFGAASSPGCANFALKYHAKQCENKYPDAARFIEENFYVDDGLKSCETEEEALHLIETTKKVCKLGGMELHKFKSNVNTITEATNSEVTKEEMINLCDENMIERALGIQWNTVSDNFTFSFENKNYPSTRRGILSAVASIYDPLGFISPFVLKGKSLLQEMCKVGTSWDDELPDHLAPLWLKWLEDSSKLSLINIPRCVRPKTMKEVTKYELHHFCDGSTKGYGQCSYLRVINENQVHCTLIAAKSRVAPVKLTTIPRLELTAACVSAKMSHMLKQELQLPIAEEYFWCDSKVVLSYINNNSRRFHVFVANRLTKIHELTEENQWHYIASKENPADVASRGSTITELLTSNWFTGPSFLLENSWRIADEEEYPLNVGDPEVRKVTTLKSIAREENQIVDKLAKYSNWLSVIIAIGRLKRTARLFKKKEALTVYQERLEAEIFVVKSLQESVFKEEIKDLSMGKEIKRTSSLIKLNPFIDENNVIRVGGRLQNGDFPDSVKHPVILPKGHHITELLIKFIHEKIKHQGRGITLNEIRAHGYWVIGGSKAVQNLIHRCVICRKLRRPAEEQQMAVLPEDRVKQSAPFTFCGMDCFGPFIVKKGRKEVKRYGLVITCLYCRGVHIEMLEDMSTDVLINALRCFIAIRGTVKQIRCDQGSNFIGASNEFKDALKDMSKVESFLAKQQCEFLFNPPSSSHRGGSWERQIKSIRNVLNATVLLSNGRLDDSSLRTFFYEAMAIINGRPITVDTINDASAPEPLTPNHLIMMKSSPPPPPPGEFVKEDMYITKRWRRVQYLTEVFWGRWRKEYIQCLNTRSKWNKTKRNMMVGDIVLIRDDNLPRMQWPLAVVEQVIPSSDGLIRTVKIRQGTKGSTLERPVQKLVLLVEANCSN